MLCLRSISNSDCISQPTEDLPNPAFWWRNWNRCPMSSLWFYFLSSRYLMMYYSSWSYRSWLRFHHVLACIACPGHLLDIQGNSTYILGILYSSKIYWRHLRSFRRRIGRWLLAWGHFHRVLNMLYFVIVSEDLPCFPIEFQLGIGNSWFVANLIYHVFLEIETSAALGCSNRFSSQTPIDSLLSREYFKIVSCCGHLYWTWLISFHLVRLWHPECLPFYFKLFCNWKIWIWFYTFEIMSSFE